MGQNGAALIVLSWAGARHKNPGSCGEGTTNSGQCQPRCMVRKWTG